MEITIPEKCKDIIRLLEDNGYEAYAVGGCVRDSLLGFVPNDWDITTNATPSGVKDIFDKEAGYSVIPTGEKYGTITVYCRDNKETYEVTTYRLDGNYTDGRRPDSVSFSDNLAEDLCRRDFTINAIAYTPAKGIIDLHDGKRHLEDKVLCLVGDPNERLREDGLRIMRAIRFSYKLKFIIEPKTYGAITQAVKLGYLDHISKERIREELIQILEYFDYEDSTYGLFEQVLFAVMPDLKDMKDFDQKNVYHVFDLWTHSLIAMVNTPPNFVLRLTMLLHDIGKVKTFTVDAYGAGHFYGHPKASVEIAEKILNDLKFDNKTKATVLRLIEHHDTPPMDTKKMIKRMLSKIGRDNLELLFDVRFADIAAHNPKYIYEKYVKLQAEKGLLTEVLAEQECFSLKDLKINGDDLIAFGLKGKEIGKWLDKCLDLVLDDDSKNNREILLDFIRSANAEVIN